MPLPKHAKAFDEKLLEWYQEQFRPLPWRKKSSLYRTVVSEFMCQQTQIATVLPYFARWMDQLPDFAALAAAEESQVVKLWEGLGYYSRARNLHKLAQKWIETDTKPKTADAWLAYPGVGPYTAAAIASITYHEKAAVVDGNVVRILARLTNNQTEFTDNGKAVKAFTSLANELIAVAQTPGDHNQAMMELGATLCAKANPQCLLCPVREFCAGNATGEPTSLPRFIKRATIQRRIDRAFLVHKNCLLLHRIPTHAKRLAGMNELPPLEICGKSLSTDVIVTHRRSIANERIEERFLRLNWSAELERHIAKESTLYWQPLDELDAITFTGPHRKWLTDLVSE